MNSTPHVIWPAPCLPAFVEGEQRRVAILVEHEGCLDDLQEWASGLALVEKPSLRRITLPPVEVRAYDHATHHPYAKQYLQQRTQQRPLFEIVVEVPRALDPPSPRTAIVFDLQCQGQTVRPNAVAVLAENLARLRFAFATDLHVASAWDVIASAMERHAPDLGRQFCHPQRLLADFLVRMNKLAARGELDLVVLGGDLVDHVFPVLRRHSTAVSDSNVQLLLDMLAELTVPVLAIPGNHDYRVNPWRPRSFGLGSVGIPKRRLRGLLEPAGLWDAWRLMPSDRDALRTHAADGVDGLLWHLSLLAPATDFSVDLRGTRLVFFATGRDMVLRWRGLDWRRRALLARALPTSWEDPDSQGPSRAQMRWLSHTLANSHNAAVFFHAPLLCPQPQFRVEERLAHLHPGEDEALSTQVSFEHRLHRSGLRHGVSFRNPGPLLRALTSVAGAVTTFSGHVHRSSRIELERKSWRPTAAAISSERNGSDVLSMHIGAALGHVRSPGSDPPAFLLAEIEAGILRRVEEQRL